jgi:hypothetical protein
MLNGTSQRDESHHSDFNQANRLPQRAQQVPQPQLYEQIHPRPLQAC